MPRIGESPTPEQLDIQRAANQARGAALRRLITNHQDEYDSILAEERTSRGLLPASAKGNDSYWRSRVARLEHLLREHGIPPTI